MALTYRHGPPVTGRVTDSDLAREPRSLGIIAWYDGWSQGHGMPAKDYPRHLTTAEAREWREGHGDARRERSEWEDRCPPRLRDAPRGHPVEVETNTQSKW